MRRARWRNSAAGGMDDARECVRGSRARNACGARGLRCDRAPELRRAGRAQRAHRRRAARARRSRGRSRRRCARAFDRCDRNAARGVRARRRGRADRSGVARGTSCTDRNGCRGRLRGGRIRCTSRRSSHAARDRTCARAVHVGLDGRAQGGGRRGRGAALADPRVRAGAAVADRRRRVPSHTDHVHRRVRRGVRAAAVRRAAVRVATAVRDPRSRRRARARAHHAAIAGAVAARATTRRGSGPLDAAADRDQRRSLVRSARAAVSLVCAWRTARQYLRLDRGRGRRDARRGRRASHDRPAARRCDGEDRRATASSWSRAACSPMATGASPS